MVDSGPKPKYAEKMRVPPPPPMGRKSGKFILLIAL